MIAELAFKSRARITPHSNPNWTCFVVIEGGGWVGVGDERARVTAGEAVVWPPDVLHGAWTDGSPMRAIVVEFAAPAAALPATTIDGEVRLVGPGATPVERGEGRLVTPPGARARRSGEAEAEGEPE